MPIAFSIPDGVSHILGVGLPFQGTTVIDLTMIPPRLESSTNAAPSRPAPNVPDATRTGFDSSTQPRGVVRSTPSAAIACQFPGGGCSVSDSSTIVWRPGPPAGDSSA